ncbi:MAG: helix-turn-helix transcriptional regulator [Candidatus Methylomirabilis oxyfera]|nr:helix-turn-helix transcriptional regulator [Candidatus Methylomirabilis oxyfera]
MPNARMLTQQALCRLLRLTPGEAEILCWVTQGKTNAEIGRILGVSPRTVQEHLEHIYHKLGVQTRMAVAVLRVLPLPWHWSQQRPRDRTVSQTIGAPGPTGQTAEEN